MLYLALDGDDVGQRLEYFMLTNDMSPLSAFSISFQAAMIWLEKVFTEELGASIVFSGGDSLLAHINDDTFSLETVESIKADFAMRAQSTLSIGLGSTPREAYLSLKFAKVSGKNCIKRI